MVSQAAIIIWLGTRLRGSLLCGVGYVIVEEEVTGRRCDVIVVEGGVIYSRVEEKFF